MTLPRVPGAEATLLSIAVVFRVVGAVWLVTLSLLTLRLEQLDADARTWVIGAIAVATIWTVVTGIVWFRFPTWLGTNPWLMLDLTLGALVAIVPSMSGSLTYFVGGFPISSAILVATTRGIPGGVVGGTVIAAASAIGSGSADARLAEILAINLLTPIVVGWGFQSIRRNDQRRRAAEAELETERAHRIRADERAELGAHLHDSVLQTLALIQRRSTDPGEVFRLARGQERELRAWLNDDGRRPEGFTDSILDAVGDIEASHGVAIEVSTVGDRPLDETALAVVKATREALINAAKFAATDRIFVLSEARNHALRVVVRDRGDGFDPDRIDDERRGVRESIVGRLERVGGRATISSSSDSGTEIDLFVHLEETS